MTNYNRYFLPGGTYFFTVNLAERDKTTLINHVDDLRGVFAEVKQEQPFAINAIVILPDHLHAIWTLPEGDSNFPDRWRKIKANFSQLIPKGERLSDSRNKKGERGVWQRRYWEHAIRDELDYQRHVDYIHYNPVKHRYCDKLIDWPYSSFHRFVDKGFYTKDWGVNLDFSDTEFGEVTNC